MALSADLLPLSSARFAFCAHTLSEPESLTLPGLKSMLLGTLRRQLTVGVTLVVAVVLVLFGWDAWSRQQALFEQRLAAISTSLARALAAAAVDDLAAADQAALQRLMQAQRQLPQVLSATLLDPRGQVLAHTDPSRVGSRVAGIPQLAQAPAVTCVASQCEAIAPIMQGAQLLGWAQLLATRQAALAALNGTVHIALLYALAAVLASAALAAAVATQATRRLARIQRVADEVERGELSQRVALKGTDEAAQLARTFDHMLDGLTSSRAALAESEQRLLVALEAASMVAWHWDIGTDRTEWGDAKQSLLGPMPAGGYPDFRQMVVPEDRDAYLAVGRAALAGSPSYEVEFRLRRTDGAVRWLVTAGRVIRDAQGQPLAMTGVTQDITERKTVQQVLQRTEAAWTEAMSQFDDVLFVVDRERRLLRANRAFYAMVGRETAEPLGRPLALLLHPLGEATPCAVCRAQLEMRDANFVLEADDPANLARRPFSVRVRVIRGDDGEFSGCLTAMHDLTGERALAAELSAYRDHLEELVAERTADLTAARVEAERLARVKSEFLANMSHEIRTPLSAVLGLAELGLQDSQGRSSAGTFERIRDSGQHLLGVINDILDFSRLDAGKLTTESRPFELSVALARASGIVGEAVQARGLGFAMSLAPGLPIWVLGDAQRLQQILVNLLANAVKFTQQGRVDLRVSSQGDVLQFEVSDTGIGMSADHVARLFEPFEQADGSTTRRYGGSGLGLAISRNLAQLMGGQITVASVPGQGSCFTLCLPLPAAQPVPEEGPQNGGGKAAQRLAGLRVLAAEDVDVNRLILEAYLEREGARVVFAENGQLLLDQIAEHGAEAFDVVLMDVQMPVMDGFAAAMRLRETAPRLPVIGLTAHALADERDKCLAAGMVHHLTKPIDVDALVAAILRHAVPARGRGVPAQRSSA